MHYYPIVLALGAIAALIGFAHVVGLTKDGTKVLVFFFLVVPAIASIAFRQGESKDP